MEIERKFLVKKAYKQYLNEPALFKQGYLNSSPERNVRVRISDNKGIITIKGQMVGIKREEYEYEIPLRDAEIMLENICEKPIIEKYRYKYQYEGFIWEIDEFCGENNGLVIAEIELSEENQTFSKPDWVGQEVTNDYRYLNCNLVKNPYKNWVNKFMEGV